MDNTYPALEFTTQEDLEGLCQALAMNEQEYLAMILSDTEQARHQALLALKARVNHLKGGETNFITVFHEPGRSLVDGFLPPLLEHGLRTKTIVFLDFWSVAGASPNEWMLLFKKMNILRSRLIPRKGGALIILLPSKFIQDFANRAPDLWSFCQCTIRLDPPHPPQHYKGSLIDVMLPLDDPHSFFQDHYSQLIAFIQRKTRRLSPLEREELSNTIIYHLTLNNFSILQSAPKGTYLLPFLNVICRNFSRLSYRSQRRHVDFEQMDDDPYSSRIPLYFDSKGTSHEFLIDLQKAISKLSQDEQAIINMRYYYGMTYHETSHVLSKTIQAIKMIESRALRKLRARMGIDDRSPIPFHLLHSA